MRLYIAKLHVAQWVKALSAMVKPLFCGRLSPYTMTCPPIVRYFAYYYRHAYVVYI